MHLPLDFNGRRLEELTLLGFLVLISLLGTSSFSLAGRPFDSNLLVIFKTQLFQLSLKYALSWEAFEITKGLGCSKTSFRLDPAQECFESYH